MLQSFIIFRQFVLYDCMNHLQVFIRRTTTMNTEKKISVKTLHERWGGKICQNFVFFSIESLQSIQTDFNELKNCNISSLTHSAVVKMHKCVECTAWNWPNSFRDLIGDGAIDQRSNMFEPKIGFSDESDARKCEYSLFNFDFRISLHQQRNVCVMPYDLTFVFN